MNQKLKNSPRGQPIQPEKTRANFLENKWGAKACEFIKNELDKRGMSYRELAEALGREGVEISPMAVNLRVNRGEFSAGFLFACLRALNLPGVEFDGDTLAPVEPGQRKAKVKAAGRKVAVRRMERLDAPSHTLGGSIKRS